MLLSTLRRHIALPTALFLSLMPIGIVAKDFTVTTNLDQVDTNPGDGACLTAVDECSLRAAVMEANALTGDDRIYLSAGQYDLTRNDSNENPAQIGDLDITGNTSIFGQGVTETIITGNFEFRIFSIIQPDGESVPEVTISNMTLTQGVPNQYGAVISNNGTLNLDNVIIENAGNDPEALLNTPALYNDGTSLLISNSIFQSNSLALYSKNSKVTIENSAFNNNTNIVAAKNEPSAAIYSNNDKISISSSTFQENTSLSSGAAIHAVNSDVSIVGSTFKLNTTSAPDQSKSAFGGALYLSSQSTTTISGSTFTNNSAAGAGGAIFHSSGDLHIEQSTFTGNSAILPDNPSFGGAIAIEGDTSRKTAVTIEESVISGNSSGHMGGGIFSYAQSNSTETIFITNSEISHNSANDGAGLYLAGEQKTSIGNTTISNNTSSNSGAGIFFGESDVSKLTLANVTLAFNDSESGANLFVANGTLDTTHTIFSNPLTGDNCIGNINSLRYNLASDSTCSLTASKKDIVNANPLLLPLSDNNGTTRTHALDQESPAIDGGDSTRCKEFAAFDQRYYYRSDEKCDIGAFEQNSTLANRGMLSFATKSSTARELDSYANVVVSRTGGSETAIFGSLRDTLSGTAKSRRDYKFPNIKLLWADGDSEDKTFAIPLVDNSALSDDKNIFVELSSASNGVSLAPDAHEIIILDDENRRGVAEFSRITFEATESDDNAYVELIRKNGAAGELSIIVTTSDGTATAEQDYSGKATTAIFPDGVLKISHPISIKKGQNKVYEPNDFFNVSIIEENDATRIGDVTMATVTILDDDTRPANPGKFSFEYSNYAIDEFRTAINVYIIRSGGMDSDLYLYLRVNGGTAKLGEDYSKVNNSRKVEQRLFFPAGKKSLAITVSLKNDSVPEEDKTLRLSLFNPSIGAILDNIRDTTITIIDNDGNRARLSFDKESYTIYKDTKFIDIDIIRSRETVGVSSVKINLFNGSSIYGSNPWPPKDLLFKRGETKYTLKVDVSDINSELLGGNMSLFLSHATNGELGKIRNTTITFSSNRPANKSTGNQLSKGTASLSLGYLMLALALLLLMRRVASRTFTFRM